MKKLISATPEELYARRKEFALQLVNDCDSFAPTGYSEIKLLFDKSMYGEDLRKLTEDNIVFLHDFQGGKHLSGENVIKALNKRDVAKTYTTIRELCSEEAKKELNTWERFETKDRIEFWRDPYMGHQLGVIAILHELFSISDETICEEF